MGLTHVTATDRLERRMRRDVVRVGVGDLVLLVTSLVAAAAITLAYAGRTRAAAWSIAHDGVPAAIVNLSTVRTADELEPIVRRAVESAPDSKFAARLWAMKASHAMVQFPGKNKGKGVPISDWFQRLSTHHEHLVGILTRH